MFKKIKESLFDIIYNVIWIKPWAAVAIFLIGLLCFLVYFRSNVTAKIFSNISEYEKVAIIDGTIKKWDYHQGGSKSGTEHLSITLQNEEEYFLLNDVLDKCMQRNITDCIETGDFVELHIFDCGTNYNPRIYAISINEKYFLIPEEGIHIYETEGKIIADENLFMQTMGFICCLYPIIVFFVRKFLWK